MSLDKKKLELKNLIDMENGKGFHRNVDLSGYVFYRGKSFISFKFVTVEGVQVCKISYIYLTNKKDLVKLLSFCINFWAGNNVKFLYFLEHCREANYCKKYLSSIGFNVIEEERKDVWKYPYISSNGYKENDIKEYFL